LQRPILAVTFGLKAKMMIEAERSYQMRFSDYAMDIVKRTIGGSEMNEVSASSVRRVSHE